MNLEIISPKGILFQGEVDEVSFPGIEGRFDVLSHHAPLITALEKGVIEYKSNGIVNKKSVSSGFIEIADDIISVCVE